MPQEYGLRCDVRWIEVGGGRSLGAYCARFAGCFGRQRGRSRSEGVVTSLLGGGVRGYQGS
jgi:hypothetical protein